MRTTPYCLVCAMQQAWKTLPLAQADEATQRLYLHDVARYVAQTPAGNSTPADYSTPVYRMLVERTGVADLYADVRAEQNRLALGLLDHVEAAVRAHRQPLLAAARVAGAGNLIDSGIGVPADIERALIAAADRPFRRDESARFFDLLRRGGIRSLLYILDNAGEIVFDRLFMQILKEHFAGLRIVAAVKGGPIINDALLDDARQTGVDAVADEIVTTGVAMVGAPLARVGEEFRRALEESDAYLSKGQGNYETLDERPGGFLVLTAKCSVVAQALGVAEGEMAFVAGGATPVAG